jgi:hypothetical protein
MNDCWVWRAFPFLVSSWVHKNRESASERASEPTCLTSSRNKPTTQKRIQNRQARKTRAGDFGVLEDLRKSASSLSECVFGKTPNFFPFFFLTRSRLQLGSTSDFLKTIWRNLVKFRPTYTHVFSFHGKKMAQIRQISKGKFPNRQISMISSSR